MFSVAKNKTKTNLGLFYEYQTYARGEIAVYCCEHRLCLLSTVVHISCNCCLLLCTSAVIVVYSCAHSCDCCPPLRTSAVFIVYCCAHQLLLLSNVVSISCGRLLLCTSAAVVVVSGTSAVIVVWCCEYEL